MNSIRRIYALFLRQLYLIKGSPPRIISYCFWPTMEMIVWGFLNQYLYNDKAIVAFSMSLLLGARLLYSFTERSQVQIVWGFLEDVWARNIGNLMISPLRPMELIAGVIVNGFISTSIGMLCAYVTAYFLFDYTIFEIGISVIPMLLILILSSWWLGLLLVTFILRYGAGGEHFCWIAGFILLPFTAVFYPVAVLPEWMQAISWILPPTYVFEALRQLIDTGELNTVYIAKGFILNFIFLSLSIANVLYQLKKARQRGGLFSMSE